MASRVSIDVQDSLDQNPVSLRPAVDDVALMSESPEASLDVAAIGSDQGTLGYQLEGALQAIAVGERSLEPEVLNRAFGDFDQISVCAAA